MIQFDNVKIFTDNIEQEALMQLKTLCATKIFGDAPIRVMPDVHAGAGCVIGFTVPLGDKVIPNIVGVDISCGMHCVELGNVDIDLKQLDEIVHQYVPAGRNVGEVNPVATQLIQDLYCKSELKEIDHLERSLGSLGGGNHFVELDVDSEGNKYLVIHSGSRNLGLQVAKYYQTVAVKECKSADTASIIAELKAQGRDKEISTILKELKPQSPKLPKDLCYLSGDSMRRYLHDMQVCSCFATLNRKRIADNIISHLLPAPEKSQVVPTCFRYPSFTTCHNYISEDGYIRKGAISAKKGQRVLIPLNMRDGAIIGIGKGNPDWNYSAPHGAGRVMSRAQAREQLSTDEFTQTMQGIYSTTVSEQTIDEAPMAYKPAQEIINLVQETVEIERIIKPIYNFKAGE